MVKNELKRIIVAAVAQNDVIGYRNQIPWNSKEELRNFRRITLNSPIIFGRKTYDSLKKQLDKRLNIVISSNSEKYQSNNNLLSFTSLRNAYLYLRKNNYEKVYICGGGSIYRNSIKHAEEMMISFMKFESVGDAKFPKINSDIWEIDYEEEFCDFVFRNYIRKKLYRLPY